MRLKEKVAIVTGGGRGIGRAIALRFALEGASVAIAARTESEITEVSKEITEKGGKGLAFWVNVTDEVAVSAMVKEVIGRFGGIHILVNNAGTTPPMKSITETEVGEWDQFMRANLRGAFLCSKAVVPFMQNARCGSIINMSGTFAKAAVPFTTVVAAAKAGLEGFTRALAAEVGGDGIRVNAIAPGRIEGTRLTDELMRRFTASAGVSEELLIQKMRDQSLLKRFATLDDLASLATFLASDECPNITGQCIQLDAGFIT